MKVVRELTIRNASRLTLGACLLCASAPALEAQGGDGILRERRSRDPNAAAKDAFEGLAPPALELTEWIGAADGTIDLSALSGKVVLISFFSSESAAARRMLPQLNDLVRLWKGDDLVVLGIHAQEGGEGLADLVASEGIEFPVAWDRGGSVHSSWMVDDRPDFWILGRDGRVRAADLADSAIGVAVQLVLPEDAPEKPLLRPSQAPVDGRVQALVERWPRAVYGLFYNDVRIGTYTATSSLEPLDGQGQAPARLVLEDELVVSIQELRIRTSSRCEYAVSAERIELLEAQVEYRGAPTGDAEASYVRSDEQAIFHVRGKDLKPRFPFITDLFLTRAPALTATDYDPTVRRSWMNFVDGRVYDGVFFRPHETKQRSVLGEDRSTRRWVLFGEGQAAASDYEYDEHGMLLYANLEQSLEIVLERAPKHSQSPSSGGDTDEDKAESSDGR